jgi:hypothetical protein
LLPLLRLLVFRSDAVLPMSRTRLRMTMRLILMRLRMMMRLLTSYRAVERQMLSGNLR